MRFLDFGLLASENGFPWGGNNAGSSSSIEMFTGTASATGRNENASEQIENRLVVMSNIE